MQALRPPVYSLVQLSCQQGGQPRTAGRCYDSSHMRAPNGSASISHCDMLPAYLYIMAVQSNPTFLTNGWGPTHYFAITDFVINACDCNSIKTTWRLRATAGARWRRCRRAPSRTAASAAPVVNVCSGDGTAQGVLSGCHCDEPSAPRLPARARSRHLRRGASARAHPRRSA